jgi:hypothetical protein
MGTLQQILVGLVILTSAGSACAQSVGKSQTILINGFASAVPFIGYGMKNLQAQIPGSQLYSYVGPVEGWTVIAPKVIGDVRKAYRENPATEINLNGVSFGANLLTRIVAVLDKDGIPISYLGIVDGLPLTPITPNVRRVDNFTCTAIGCLRDKIELTAGNDLTIHSAFKYDTTHIELPNKAEVQQRILRQITSYPLDVAEAGRGEAIVAPLQLHSHQ